MGIYKEGKPVMHIYYHGLPIYAVYTGNKKVWPGIIDQLPSCFGAGYWQDEYPWTDDIAWVD